MRNFMLAAAAVCAVATSGPASAQAVLNGVGRVPIKGDAETVRAQAEEAAKLDLVQALARQTIGAERVGELSPDLVRRLARQLRPDMIVNRTSQKIGKEFEVTLSARIEQSWFQGLLDAEGVDSSVGRAGGGSTRILVMLDESIGTAQDYAAPAEIVTEYDRNSGASYSDKSVSAYSEKDRSASTFKGAAGSSVRGSTSAAYSDGYGGAAAGRSSGAASSAVKVQSASASSHSVSSIDKTDVQASVHDNERFRQRITFQSASSNGPSSYAKTRLNQRLKAYGVEVAEDRALLSSYFNGAAPTFTTLRDSSALYVPFLRNAARQEIQFFMGGTIQVRHAGRDPATGQTICTGALDATAFASANSLEIGSGAANGEARGTTYELCASKLADNLADEVGAVVGPQVQNYWRKQSRDQQRIVAAAQAGASEYTLVVRGSNLSMAAQADLLDALGSTPGVEKSVFLGQSGDQISFQVRYGANLPLQMALFQKLRANPAFAQMKATTQGQSVTLCLTAC